MNDLSGETNRFPKDTSREQHIGHRIPPSIIDAERPDGCHSANPEHASVANHASVAKQPGTSAFGKGSFDTIGDRLSPANEATAHSEKPSGQADEDKTGCAASSISCDVVIVGCGVGGLYCALNLPRELSIVMLAKTTVDECDSMLAQGGICVQHDDNDYAPFFEDTLLAGHFENRCESVDLMIRASRSVIDDLVAHGVEFERDAAGNLRYTREGAHGRARICFHDDTTGAEITSKLLAAVQKLPNVRILENTCMDDIVVGSENEPTGNAHCSVARPAQGAACFAHPQTERIDLPHRSATRPSQGAVSSKARTGAADQRKAQADRAAFETATEPPLDFAKRETCCGVIAHDASGRQLRINAHATVWATGGIGGTYERSTNFPALTGDALRIARGHNIALEHTDYVQIHPTSLYTRKPGRAFLISESCRGEGAVLLNAAGERFTDELQPRDVVSAAILSQMELDGTDHVRLSFASVPKDEVTSHFRHIYEHCLAQGYDITREPIPVVPAQHYFMGGVHVDRDSATTMPRLYAVGETSCNGVHGKNRLASNSLLESLVFAQRAAWDIAHKLRLPAPHPQTYAEQPQGADAVAYARFCELVEQHVSQTTKDAGGGAEHALLTAAEEYASNGAGATERQAPAPAAQARKNRHASASSRKAACATRTSTRKEAVSA